VSRCRNLAGVDAMILRRENFGKGLVESWELGARSWEQQEGSGDAEQVEGTPSSQLESTRPADPSASPPDPGRLKTC